MPPHYGVDLLYEGDGEEPPGHTRLVCDHHYDESMGLEQMEGINGPGQPSDFVEAGEIVSLLDEGSIPIEEYGADLFHLFNGSPLDRPGPFSVGPVC